MWCIIYCITALLWAILAAMFVMKEDVLDKWWEVLIIFLACLIFAPITMIIIVIVGGKK